jgi:predicted unusual protein kinase regulating ubiquinone biosynthesis (AarF/ABC1/UbiB family)
VGTAFTWNAWASGPSVQICALVVGSRLNRTEPPERKVIEQFSALLRFLQASGRCRACYRVHVFSNIILMEYIKGSTIKDIKNADYCEYSKQIIKFVLVTTLINGVCHGDLHMGNILFIKDETDKKYKYKLGILDFGIVYEINKIKNTLYYIFANLYTDLPEKIAQNLLESGILEPVDCIIKIPQNHYKYMLGILTKFINDTIYISKHFCQINAFKSLYELNDYITENNLYNPKETSKILKIVDEIKQRNNHITNYNTTEYNILNDIFYNYNDDNIKQQLIKKLSL